MEINYGKGKTAFGTGVDIKLDGDEVALAIDAYLVAQGVSVRGPRTININDKLIDSGSVYVDPCGFVIDEEGRRFEGRGPQNT